MSRLYIVGQSDMIKAPRTARAKQSAQAEIRYGSSADSRLAVRVAVEYPIGALQPKVTVTIGDGLIWGKA